MHGTPSPTTDPHSGIYALDLRPLGEDRLASLRRAAIAAGLSLPAYLASLVDQASARLLAGPDACDPDAKGARAAVADHRSAA